MSAAKRKELGDHLARCAEAYVTATNAKDMAELGEEDDIPAHVYDTLSDAYRALLLALHQWKRYGEQHRDPLGR